MFFIEKTWPTESALGFETRDPLTLPYWAIDNSAPADIFAVVAGNRK